MIEVLGVKNADKLVPTKDDAKPADPISENMDALIGKPMKAFIYQDHDAHISYTYVVYARPYGCSDDWAKPTGKTDYGVTTGAHCRTPWVLLSQENRREAGRTATYTERGDVQKTWKYNCHVWSQTQASSYSKANQQQAAQKTSSADNSKTQSSR